MKGGRVKHLTESGGRTRILNADEESRLLEAAGPSSWPRLRLFVRMALTSAARVASLELALEGRPSRRVDRGPWHDEERSAARAALGL